MLHHDLAQHASTWRGARAQAHASRVASSAAESVGCETQGGARAGRVGQRRGGRGRARALPTPRGQNIGTNGAACDGARGPATHARARRRRGANARALGALGAPSARRPRSPTRTTASGGGTCARTTSRDVSRRRVPTPPSSGRAATARRRRAPPLDRPSCGYRVVDAASRRARHPARRAEAPPAPRLAVGAGIYVRDGAARRPGCCSPRASRRSRTTSRRASAPTSTKSARGGARRRARAPGGAPRARRGVAVAGGRRRAVYESDGGRDGRRAAPPWTFRAADLRRGRRGTRVFHARSDCYGARARRRRSRARPCSAAPPLRAAGARRAAGASAPRLGGGRRAAGRSRAARPVRLWRRPPRRRRARGRAALALDPPRGDGPAEPRAPILSPDRRAPRCAST